MTDRRMPLIAAIAILGIGLLAATFVLWVQGAQIRTNQALIRQQQATAELLLQQGVEDRQALSAQQRLTQALQRQVRQLGGTPLTQAPPEVTPSPGRTRPVASPSPRPSRGSVSPRPTRTATPTPTGSSPQSPTPSPTSSPTCRVKIGPICL